MSSQKRDPNSNIDFGNIDLSEKGFLVKDLRDHLLSNFILSFFVQVRESVVIVYVPENEPKGST